MNDNFFFCLNQLLPISLIWKTEEELKKFVGIKRNEFLEIKYLGNIENKLDKKYKINISGDVIRKSQLKTPFKISLILKHKQYSVKNNFQIVKGIAHEEKEIILYDPEIDENGKRLCYLKNKKAKISINFFNEIRKFPISSEFILIKAKYQNFNNKKETLKQNYQRILREAEALKKATNGIVNIFITGGMPKTARDLFFKMVRTLKTKKINFEEATFIEEASNGPIMFAQKYTGPAYSYDFVSHYGFILQDHHMLFPIKSGEFKTLTQSEFISKKYVSYGIYKCKIFESKDININKLFRFVSNNHYTHIDINSAIELKLKIEMIEDGEPNFLFYSRDCLIQGHLLFKPYVDMIFNLKKQKIEGSKELLNCLWGSLTQSNVLTATFEIDKGLFIQKNKEILEFIPTNDENVLKAKIINKNQYFETDFARIKPFILAKGRYVLKKHALPFANNIKFMHTDSMITNKKLDIKTNDDLGCLKYEGFAKEYNITHIGKKDDKKLFKL